MHTFRPKAKTKMFERIPSKEEAARVAALLTSDDEEAVLRGLRHPDSYGAFEDEALAVRLLAHPSSAVQDVAGRRVFLGVTQEERADPDGAFRRRLPAFVEAAGSSARRHACVHLDVLPPALVAEMAGDPNEDVRLGVASFQQDDWLGRVLSESIPSAVVILLSEDPSAKVRGKIASRRFLPSGVCEALAQDADASVRQAAAQDHHGDAGFRRLSDSTLLRLSEDSDTDVVRAVASRCGDVPEGCLSAAVAAGHERAVLDRRQDLPPSIQDILFSRGQDAQELLSERQDTSTRLLLLCLGHSKISVRRSAIHSLSTKSRHELLDGLSALSLSDPRRVPKIRRLLREAGLAG